MNGEEQSVNARFVKSDGMEHGEYKVAFDTALALATHRSTTYNPSKKVTVHTAQPAEKVDQHRPEDTQVIICIIPVCYRSSGDSES